MPANLNRLQPALKCLKDKRRDLTDPDWWMLGGLNMLRGCICLGKAAVSRFRLCNLLKCLGVCNAARIAAWSRRGATAWL